MQLVKEVNYQVSIKAILTLDEKAEPVITLSVAAPYGNRTATTTVNDFSEEVKAAIRVALSQAIEEKLQEGLRLAETAAAQAHVAAVALGEEI